MKKIGSVLAAATAFLLLTALPAAAGYAPPPPVPGGTHGARGGDGTAFTGSDLTVGALLLGVLIVVGVAALLIGRRVSARRQPVATP
jgi:hypothetical protein